MELTAIPGVGEKTAAALEELDDVERAIEEGDVARLASAPGISAGRAVRIARGAIRRRHDDPGEFLATDRAEEVYRELLELLTDRAVTEYGARRLETFYPSAVESRIEETRQFTERALERTPADAVDEALAGVEPLEPAPDVVVRDRCLATTDAERYATAREAMPELSVEIVDDARDLAELARGYSTVIALDETFAGVDVEGDVRVEPDALERPADIVPERILSFFAANRDRIRAAIAVHRAADLETPLDLDTFDDQLERLDESGDIIGDTELDRLAAAVDNLDGVAADAEQLANQRLREAIKERDVTIEGTDLLSLVEQGAGVDSLLSRELAEEYAAAVEAAREHLREALALTDDEAAIANRAFPDEPTYPVEREEQAMNRLREELTTMRDRRAARLKRDVAAELTDSREAVETLVRQALELDVELAIARFAADFECTMPELGGSGIRIDGGRSPLLDEPFAAVEPIDYAVEGATLLSGVNSGGKTSLLDLLAAVTVLAHMGLPVPAEEARVEPIESLYYHAKTQGTLDAGAFEHTVREFAEVATDERPRLVLVDELESITEPGASAKIIAGILETLTETATTAVFVSHLAGEIRDVASIDVGVDGIEALGLEDGELKVNRSPVKDHLARSTPELIVEKLADDAEIDADREFYDRLLGKFQ
ncbi:MAG: helix-hairpin-helix domain-containing protein [Halobacteriales archaeon]|nr:helix-hairpin-helix domain-containing protein [Halobacteriales archaeon]